MDRRRKRQLKGCAGLGLGLIVMTLAIAAFWEDVARRVAPETAADTLYVVWLPTLITLTAFIAVGVVVYLILDYVAHKEQPNPDLPTCNNPRCNCVSHAKYEDWANDVPQPVPNPFPGLSPMTTLLDYSKN